MLMSYSPQLQLLRDALAQLEYHANARAKILWAQLDSDRCPWQSEVATQPLWRPR